MCSQIWPQVNGLASRGHERSNGRILKILFFYHNFELRRSTTMVFTTIVFSSPRRVEWCIIWPKKSQKWNLTRSRSWPDPSRSCCISFDLYWREKRSGAVLKPVPCFYQKLLAKTNGGIWWRHIWPQLTLWGLTEGFLDIEAHLWQK